MTCFPTPGIAPAQKKNALRKALAGVAQWIEYWPVKLGVAGSIPSQGTCLGCGQGPQWGAYSRGNHTLIFLSLSFSLPSPLKINK